MISLTTRLAAGVAAVIAAAALAACGSASTSAPAAPATPAAATAHNATDVSFTSGIIRLEDQARAITALVATHTGNQLRGYATRLGADVTDFHRMSGMTTRWHQVMPSPYRPGAPMMGGTGPGMISGRDWSGLQHRYGHEFIDHWVDAMMANRSAELALCRHELRAGASRQARHIAQAMLAERRAQLAQLQHWHHTMGHHGDRRAQRALTDNQPRAGSGPARAFPRAGPSQRWVPEVWP